ncbi:Na/Pi-cotransporter family protein [gamma proteobacterium HdN1]|nr:Na/Pi-cotransporter family protein [gamma proteobacterium HdN1]
MLNAVFNLSGGVGLLLIGMILLSDGLREFAGEALRKGLVRFTGTPLKAFLSGTGVTLVAQSSAATTVTLIGFVSAGLLSFPQALGVVFGASVGSTGTSWLIAILGLHVSLGFYALPLVAIGALLKLLGSERWGALGLAIAGFGMMFVGIDTMQEGMKGLPSAFNLSSMPASSFIGRFVGLLLGIVLTILMQSSTAVVATTLTVLHSGAISFEQAMTLVIGGAIGTTFTGVLAAIGGSVPAKRIALAYVIFNLTAGLVAFLLLPAIMWGVAWMEVETGRQAGSVSLAAFHTLFLSAGVMIFLPLVGPYGRFLERLLPDRGPSFTRHLDSSLLEVRGVAMTAAEQALRDTARELFVCLSSLMDREPPAERKAQAQEIQRALVQIRRFVGDIPTGGGDARALMHAIDHFARLASRLKLSQALHDRLQDQALKQALDHCRQTLALARDGLDGSAPEDWLAQLKLHAKALTDLRKQERHTALRLAGGSRWGPLEALEVVDALRWVERVGYHCWRTCHYLTLDPKQEKDAALAASSQDSPDSEED